MVMRFGHALSMTESTQHSASLHKRCRGKSPVCYEEDIGKQQHSPRAPSGPARRYKEAMNMVRTYYLVMKQRTIAAS
jgi:hypothetical protein